MARKPRDRRKDVHGESACLKSLEERLLHHVITRYLRAVQTLEEGRAGEALALFAVPMNEHPKCLRIRYGLLWVSEDMGNSALTRETLEGVVECGVLPGIQSGQSWRYPPVHYMCQLADHLLRSAPTRKKGLHLLRLAPSRDQSQAETWHVLGDLLWQMREVENMLLAYRFASCLESTNERSAQSYADALHEMKREKQGLAWLETRVTRFASSPRSTGPWVSWIGAIEVCKAALELHADSSELLAFAVPFLARMGIWEDSLEGVRRMEAGNHRALHLQAAVVIHRMRGRSLQGAFSVRCVAGGVEPIHRRQARQAASARFLAGDACGGGFGGMVVRGESRT